MGEIDSGAAVNLDKARGLKPVHDLFQGLAMKVGFGGGVIRSISCLRQR